MSLLSHPLGFGVPSSLPVIANLRICAPISMPSAGESSGCPLETIGYSSVKVDKDRFRVVLDVQQFAPDEISVKLVDGHVVVEGRHEERRDEHGWVTREFRRRYPVPEECDIDQVSSKLSSDGLLSISIPRRRQDGVEGERIVTIEQTGKPAVREHHREAKEEPEEELGDHQEGRSEDKPEEQPEEQPDEQHGES